MKDCERFSVLMRRGDDESIEELTRHTAECPSCRDQLDDWDRISDAAAGLRESWETPDLFSRISQSVQDDLHSSTSMADKTGSSSWSFVMQWAAVVLVTVSLGVTYVRSLGPAAADDPRVRVEEWILRESAIADVDRAEKAHIESIDRLSIMVADELDEPASPLLVSYKEKLLLLDDAIEECQAEIEKNRYNAHLRKQLLAVYDEKDRTLRELLEERP